MANKNMEKKSIITIMREMQITTGVLPQISEDGLYQKGQNQEVMERKWLKYAIIHYW